MVFTKLAFDVDSRKAAMEFVWLKRHEFAHEHEPKHKIKVIADFKQKLEYVVFIDPKTQKICHCSTRTPKQAELKQMCLPDEAKLAQNITIGGLLECNMYSLHLKRSVMKVVMAAETCLPVSVGDIDLYHHDFLSTHFWNVNSTITDETVFDPPPECSKSWTGAEEKCEDHEFLEGLAAETRGFAYLDTLTHYGVTNVFDDTERPRSHVEAFLSLLTPA